MTSTNTQSLASGSLNEPIVHQLPLACAEQINQLIALDMVTAGALG
jgi:hypothetical protein